MKMADHRRRHGPIPPWKIHSITSSPANQGDARIAPWTPWWSHRAYIVVMRSDMWMKGGGQW